MWPQTVQTVDTPLVCSFNFLQIYTFSHGMERKFCSLKSNFLPFHKCCHVLCVFIWCLSDSTKSMWAPAMLNRLVDKLYIWQVINSTKVCQWMWQQEENWPCPTKFRNCNPHWPCSGSRSRQRSAYWAWLAYRVDIIRCATHSFSGSHSPFPGAMYLPAMGLLVLLNLLLLYWIKPSVWWYLTTTEFVDDVMCCIWSMRGPLLCSLLFCLEPEASQGTIGTVCVNTALFWSGVCVVGDTQKPSSSFLCPATLAPIV